MRISLAMLMVTGALWAQPKPVPIPLGVTRLSDIGIYRVAYQSYGEEVVEMPPSWCGHFETTSGISYQPGGHLLGRDALLLHSPWRVNPGTVWVDYCLELPRTVPLKLSFGVAMRPDMVGPARSDGVTFSCFLNTGSGFQELMRYHQAEGTWTDYSFDLAKWGGKTVTLRLQTEPGPANNASFDYSYFGDAEILAGRTDAAIRETVRESLDRPSGKAVAGHLLVPLANNPDAGATPSNLLQYHNTVRRDGRAWVFSYTAPDCRLEYRYEPNTGTLDDLAVWVDDAAPFRPAAGGNLLFDENATLTVRDCEEAEGGVLVLVDAAVGDRVIPFSWHFSIRGKALVIRAVCEEAAVRRLSLGTVSDIGLRRKIPVPYLNGSVDYLPVAGLFVGRYLDWTRTNASVCGQDSSSYEAKTDNSRNPLLDVGYVSVSPSVHEVLPNIPHPPSPYLELLGPRIMLDIWGHHYDGTFQGDAVTLRELKDNGIDHLAIIQHSWQRFGYDVKLPDHIPANPKLGGDEGMAEFGKAARECGYVWSVHENYIDLYPDAPSYDPTARVLRQDGSPSPAWFNRGTGVQSYGLKCNRALEFARQNAPEIHQRYGTTAAYLDVHTCVPPWHQLDHEAGQPFAAMCRGKVQFDTELFQYMRDTHEGPLFGEGSNHFYWAGRCDGVEAQVRDREDHDPFPDFDLLKIHPQMVNHGMGYYERWFRRGYDHVPGLDSCAPFQIDKYRAQELSYGHAGFIGNLATANVQWVAREHHLMHPVQRLYGSGKVVSIEYEVAGYMVPAGIALALDSRSRQYFRYDTGLELWVNWGEEPWAVSGKTLPQWGFLARGPETEVWTAQTAVGIADFARCPEFVFADARTFFNMPYLKTETEIEPRLHSFKWLGNRKAELVYEWRVGEDLNSEYTCFVHFLNEKKAVGSGRNDLIAAQNDHALPKPTTQWRKGEILLDGPYTVEFPPDVDRFEIVIGLYNSRGRLKMKGTDKEGRRYLIGAFRVTPEGATLENLDALTAACAKAVPRADFSRNMNTPGTWIDFGVLATDGSVKVDLNPEQLIVYPYPRGRVFSVEIAPERLGLIGEAYTVVVKKELSDETLTAFEPERRGQRVRFQVGQEGAGRYLILRSPQE